MNDTGNFPSIPPRGEWYGKKLPRVGGDRICRSEGCNTILSSYNSEPICNLCQDKLSYQSCRMAPADTRKRRRAHTFASAKKRVHGNAFLDLAIKAVSHEFQLSESTLLCGLNRRRGVVRARYILFYIVYTFHTPKPTMKRVGQLLGGFKPATIHNARVDIQYALNEKNEDLIQHMSRIRSFMSKQCADTCPC